MGGFSLLKGRGIVYWDVSCSFSLSDSEYASGGLNDLKGWFLVNRLYSSAL